MDLDSGTQLNSSTRQMSLLWGPALVAGGLGFAELLAGLVRPWRSPLLAVGDAFIDRTPRVLKDLAIDWFGTGDKVALLVGMGVVIAALSLVVGQAMARRHRVVAMTVLTIFGIAGIAAAFATRTPLQSSVVPTCAAVAVTLLGAVTLSRRAGGDDQHGALLKGIEAAGARRSALGALGAIGLGLATGVVGRRVGMRFDVADERLSVQLPPVTTPAPTTTPAVTEPAIAAEPVTPDPQGAALLTEVVPAPAPAPLEPVDVLAARAPDIDGLTPLFTSNDDFYRIDTALTVPQVSINNWSLTIDGMVDEPLTLSWEELLQLPLIESDITMSCVSNEVGGGLVGTARWLGVRLDDLLAQVGVDPAADQVMGHSVDRFTAGFPLAVLDGRDALVAVGMNGEPLPAAHGYPARLVVPGLYGYVSATKWLERIELTRFDAVDGYWVARDWSQAGPMRTQSRIDTPRPLATIDAAPTAIAGVAWAQTRGIAAVEVSIDDGAWMSANLVPAVNDETWTQWWLDWSPESGRHTIAVRATDGDGQVQTAERQAPFPSGATGHHQIVVLVS